MLGASRGALARVVIEQACLVGGLGMVLAAVASALLLAVAVFYHAGGDVDGGPGCAALVVMALMSSVMAVRGLIRTDPGPAAALMETVET